LSGIRKRLAWAIHVDGSVAAPSLFWLSWLAWLAGQCNQLRPSVATTGWAGGGGRLKAESLSSSIGEALPAKASAWLNGRENIFNPFLPCVKANVWLTIMEMAGSVEKH